MRAPAQRFTLAAGLLNLTRHLLLQQQSAVIRRRKVNTQKGGIKEEGEMVATEK